MQLSWDYDKLGSRILDTCRVRSPPMGVATKYRCVAVLVSVQGTNTSLHGSERHEGRRRRRGCEVSRQSGDDEHRRPPVSRRVVGVVY